MFGGSSRRGAAALQLVGQERRAGAGRSDAMTDKPIPDLLPPDQGRASSLYDEQLQREQQEKMLLSRVEQRLDLLAPAKED